MQPGYMIGGGDGYRRRRDRCRGGNDQCPAVDNWLARQGESGGRVPEDQRLGGDGSDARSTEPLSALTCTFPRRALRRTGLQRSSALRR
jgi:hypothetical protein